MAFILVREICADLNLCHKMRALQISVVKITSFHDAHMLSFGCSGSGCTAKLTWQAGCQQHGLLWRDRDKL